MFGIIQWQKRTLVSFALGDADDINHLVLSKDGADGHGFFQMLARPVDLLGDGAAIDLDLHDVRFLLTLAQEFHLERIHPCETVFCFLLGERNYLGVGDNADDFAVAFHGLQVLLDDLLAQIVLPFLRSLGEGLLLGLVP